MGLLDGFNLDLEDPKTLGLISMAAQLIGGAPGGRKNFGADLSAGIQQGLLGYTQGKQGQMKRQAFDQDAQMRKMQMGQLERQNADQDAVRNAFSQNLQPGMPQMQPNDMETPTGPNGPSSLNMPGLQQALMRAGPAGMPHLAQLSAMNAKNYQKLSEGDSLFDMSAPGGPKAVASAAPKLPTGMVMGPNGPTFMPEYIKGQEQIRAAGRPHTTVTVDNKQESAFATKLGSQQAEDYNGLMKSDVMASSRLNKLERLSNLLTQSGKTGKFTPSVMELKAAADSLGFKVDPKLPFQQAAAALSNELALEMRNPSGGAGMPGALSDSDRQFLQNMVPNLAKTPEGNAELIGTAKKLAQREKEVAKLARDYKKANGRFDEGFNQTLSEFSQKNPLFPAQAPGLNPDEARELEILRKRFAR